MPNPYSLDLRWRIVWLHTAKKFSPTKIARLLSVSESTVRRYLRKFWLTGDVNPVDYHHGPSTLLDDFERVVILRLINENPSIYIHELKAKLLDRFGTSVSCSTIWRTLHEKMG